MPKSFDDPAIVALAENPAAAGTWTLSKKGIGDFVAGASGSKPSKIAVAPDGSNWFFKLPAHSETTPVRPYTDAVTYKLMSLIKPNLLPVGVHTIDGKVGSIQPVQEGATPLDDNDYSALSDSDMAEILAQHVADMFTGDHDGHSGNWLRLANGKLVAVDKGQSFKFILKGVKESLHPSWNAPGNFGINLAKALLLDWSKGHVEIPKVAFKAMRTAIGAVLAITDDRSKLP